MEDLQQVTMFSRYARLDEEKDTLTSWETIVDTCFDMYKARVPPELLPELAEARELTKQRVLFPSGRALQFAGAPIEKINARLYNCVGAFAVAPEILWKSFFLLLCGCGVGLSIQKHHVAMLPAVTHPQGDPWVFQIPDSIQGWADGFMHLLMSYFMHNAPPVEFDYTCIRPRGEPISVLLGKAPGPGPLRIGLERARGVLAEVKEGGKLSPLNVFDLMAHMSDAVLAGGVRRSAMLMQFSADDEEMYTCKTGDWFTDNPQRARANISALMLRKDLTEQKIQATLEFTRHYGEPGFIFADSTETCVNPCAEVSFSPWIDNEHTGVREYGFSVCNLVEVAVPRCGTVEEFVRAQRAAALVATVQASYTDFPYVGNVTERIVRRDALTGGSLTGIMEHPDIGLDPDALGAGARAFMETNERVAKIMGINPAARALVVKPSGTAAIILRLAGSGIHPVHSQEYIRRVQISNNDPISKFYERHRAQAVEKSVWAAETNVMSFAIEVPDTALTKADVSPLQLLEAATLVKMNWVDLGHRENRQPDGFNETNNVSLTVNIGNDEWGLVGRHLYENCHVYTGVSCLSNSGDTDYQQAPFQRVLSAKELCDRFELDALRDASDVDENPFVPGPQTAKFAEDHFEGDMAEAALCLKHFQARRLFDEISKHDPVPWGELRLSQGELDVHLSRRGESSCTGDSCVLRQL